jgi:hypothetical protein
VGALPAPDEHPAKREKIIAIATGRPARILASVNLEGGAMFARITFSMTP